MIRSIGRTSLNLGIFTIISNVFRSLSSHPVPIFARVDLDAVKLCARDHLQAKAAATPATTNRTYTRWVCDLDSEETTGDLDVFGYTRNRLATCYN